MTLTTKQLADKYKTTMHAIRQSKYEKGHFKGYEPCGYTHGGGQYKWEYVGSDKVFKND